MAIQQSGQKMVGETGRKEAPKARHVTAQGNALGKDVVKFDGALKARY